MAGIKDSMRSFVAGSMEDRAPIGGQSAAPAEGARSSIQRQGEGRRRLEGASEIRLDRIIPDPGQPRTEFDEVELQQLADSIRERGVLQPIRVRWDDAADRYIVIVGERRYRASGLAGLEAIPCVVAAGRATAEDILEDQLIENAIRQDLKPIEKARSYKRLIDARGFTQRQLAERLHVSQTSISQALELLGLPGPIQEKVDAGKIAPHTAVQLARVEDPAEQATLAREAEAGNLRRDDLRERASSPKKAAEKGRGGKAGPPKPRTFRTAGGKITVEMKRDASAAAIAAALREALGQVEPIGAEDQAAA